MEDFIKNLHNPPSAYRGKPFWSWNGELNISELKRQIDVMKEMGFGGFFMHSRTGLQTEYLGEEWFACIRECAKYAYSLGMEAWLYDEDRWPSGTCGGSVTRDGKYSMKYISLYRHDNDLPAISKFAVKSANDYFAVQAASEVPDGYEYCVFCVENAERDPFYNGATYLDTMNAAAVKAYIESTHELYRRHCGDLFGKEIKGIFTDEPYRASLFADFGAYSNERNRCAYTETLFSKYEKRWGESLVNKLPSLFFGGYPNETAHRYITVAQNLFLTAYAKQYSDWCKQNGLLFTGHILHEDNLTAQTLCSGAVMRFYEYMDIPGVDNLTLYNDRHSVPKQCSSVAKQLGDGKVLSEMYAASGWDAGLEQFKFTGDWQAFYGVTLRCPHLSMYTMQGAAKRDYPASILHQSGLQKDFAYLEDYFARLSYVQTECKEVCDVLVMHPAEEMWRHVRVGWSQGYTATDSRAAKLENDFIEQFDALETMHVPFEYADEELFGKYAKVESENGEMHIVLGKRRYRAVLSGFNIGEKAAALLKKFADRGGIVATHPEELRKYAVANAPAQIGVKIYEANGFGVALAMNFLRDCDIKQAHIALSYDGIAEEYDLRKGRLTGKTYYATDIVTSFVRGQERLYILRKSNQANVSGVATNADSHVISLSDGKYPYKLLEDNVLVSDSVKAELGDGKKFAGISYDVNEKIRLFYGFLPESNQSVQPWYRRKTDANYGKTKTSITLEYTFEVEFMPKYCLLAKEDALDLYVNGKRVECTDKYWVDICYRVYDISQALHFGKNAVRVTGEYNETFSVENIFVLGQFGVALPNRITKLPSLLTPHGFAAQGLPFYGGEIDFYTGEKANRNFEIIKTHNTACAKLLCGNETEYITYYPYCAHISGDDNVTLRLLLSRRNTFGPFYCKSNTDYFCAPECFSVQTKEKQLVD